MKGLSFADPFRLAVLSVLFWIAFLLGGSSAGVNYAGLWLTAVVSAIAGAWFLRCDPDPVAALPLWASRLAAAIILLPIAQLVPLPPEVWTLLPGRELETALLAHIGGDSRWMPLSLRPLDTLRAWLNIVPAYVVFLGVSRLRYSDIPKLLGAMLVAIGVSLAIGAVQVATDGASFTFYETRHHGYLLGVFSNRNHHADAVVFGFLIACSLIAQIREPTVLALALLCSVLALALFIIACGSRSGALLALLTALAALVILRPKHWAGAGIASFAAAAVLASIAAYASESGPGRSLLLRFADFSTDHRLEYWQSAWRLLAVYWTSGSGIGAFPTLYMTVEPIAVLREHYVNAAHNDYLQLAIEGGLPALLLLSLFAYRFLGTMVRLADAGARGRIGNRHAAWCMASFTVVMLVHSCVDYPLRTMAMSVAWAASIGICLRAAAVVGLEEAAG